MKQTINYPDNCRNSIKILYYYYLSETGESEKYSKGLTKKLKVIKHKDKGQHKHKQATTTDTFLRVFTWSAKVNVSFPSFF
jgi:hypothetical protein